MVQPTGTAQQHAPRLGTRSGSRSVFATRSPRMLLPRATAIPPCSPSSRSTKWGLAHDQLWFSEHLPASSAAWPPSALFEHARGAVPRREHGYW